MGEIALAMDRKKDTYMKGSYCYADGTFKRCTGFVTISVYVYVDMLRKIVKLCTMECESESEQNWTILWTNFNAVLREVSGDDHYKFCPTGYCFDEAGGMWSSLRKVFGPEEVKYAVS